MRLLLIWPYEREDLLRHLLTAVAGCQVVLLHDKHRPEGERDPGVPVRYWSEWSSPAALLDELRPDKVLFWDIESFHQAALNIAARDRRIPTFILEHGLRTRQDVVGVAADVAVTTPRRRAPNAGTLRFFFSALRLRHLRALPAILRFILVRWRRGPFALRDCRLELRNADWYITFGLAGTSYWQLREGLPLSRFLLIGNPTFDDFLTTGDSLPPVQDDPYYLLLDGPMVEIFGMAPEVKRRFLEELGRFAQRQGARLVVKLHPISYRNGQLPEYRPRAPHIVYFSHLSNAELGALVRNARGCFGLNTTLMIVAAALVPSIAITVPGREALKDLIDQGIVPALDLESLTADQIAFPAAPPPAARAALIRDYLYSTDGRATARLGEILRSPGPPPYRAAG